MHACAVYVYVHYACVYIFLERAGALDGSLAKIRTHT